MRAMLDLLLILAVWAFYIGILAWGSRHASHNLPGEQPIAGTRK